MDAELIEKLVTAYEALDRLSKVAKQSVEAETTMENIRSLLFEMGVQTDFLGARAILSADLS